ncbi:MAG: class II fructose-bisphosphate aldolase [Clostridia bacterium]|nr:class II fructose-bisphosphate aldolase [Clostridia bacterium]
MLVSLKEILAEAEKRQIAVGAFNAANLEALEAIIDAAEELELPVILQFAQCHEPWIRLSLIGPVMMTAAREAKVPVCVHLDHGEDLDYIKQALDLGFTGVMYDGSTQPYDQNLEVTKKAVEMAHAVGASVEAELGSMGRRESGLGDGSGEDDETKIYTDPKLAKAFVAESGIDALACSFGTTHGIYLKKPRLDFDVVRNVRRETNGIPVVMHGGSGVSVADFHNAVEAGVRKVNYFTYMDKAGGAAAVEALRKMEENKSPVFFSTMSMAARAEMKENVKGAMRTFARLD